MRKLIGAVLILIVVAACGRTEPGSSPPIEVVLDPETAPLDLADWGLLGDWDVDGDGALVHEEFAAALEVRGGWGAWDADGDLALDRDEFAAMVHACWDEDASGAVDQVEWRGGVDRWIGPGSEVAGFEAWDRDGTHDLDQVEVARGLGEAFVWESWDTDRNGTIDEEEFRSGTFTTWDRHPNGRLESDEWDEAVGWWR